MTEYYKIVGAPSSYTNFTINALNTASDTMESDFKKKVLNKL